MAEYKVVDAEKLDAELKSLADKIREKGGTSESLEFPQGFVNGINAIESGGGGNPFFNDWEVKNPIVTVASDIATVGELYNLLFQFLVPNSAVIFINNTPFAELSANRSTISVYWANGHNLNVIWVRKDPNELVATTTAFSSSGTALAPVPAGTEFVRVVKPYV